MKLLVPDFETWPIAEGLVAPPPVCAGLCAPGKEPWALLAEDAIDAIEDALDHDVLLVNQNISYDMGVAAEARPHLLPKIFAHYRKGLIQCTMIRQNLIDIAMGCFRRPRADGTMGYSQSDLEMHYFQRDRSAEKKGDTWRTKYHELSHLPLEQYPEEALAYPKRDAKGAMEIYFEQERRYGDIADSERQAAWDFALNLVRCWGMRVDGPRLDAVKEVCERIRNETRLRLMDQGFFVYEGPKKEPKRKIVKKSAPIQARVEAAYAKKGLQAPRNEPTDKAKAEGLPGSIKMDAETLEQSGDQDLMDLAETGPASTILKTFEPALRPGVEWPINTRYSLIETGRPSSAEPNLNNIPRGFKVKFRRDDGVVEEHLLDIRPCIVPREGFYLCSVDYDGAELRSQAQNELEMFGYSEMAEFYQKNPHGDPYIEMAATFRGITSEEALTLKKAGDKDIKFMRQLSKAIVLGVPGGMGKDRLAAEARKYDVEITPEEAGARKEQYFKRWPTKRKYLDYISDLVGFGDAQITHRWSKRKQGGVGYSDAANAFFQGRTADYAKMALFNVLFESYCDSTSPLFGSRVVGFLYDEILAEVPADVAHEAAHRIAELMVQAAAVVLPDVPSTASPALMLAWHKAAEAVYVDGRLVPWTGH